MSSHSGSRPRRTRPARWPLFVLAIALLVAAVLTLVDFDGDSTLSREGSTPVDDPEERGDLVIRSPALTYRVVYRVRQADGEATTETVWVERPFAGRVEVRAENEADGGEVIAERESTFGHLAVAGDQGPVVLVVGPRTAAPDLRPDAVLDDALEEGLLERREIRRVAGRECQVFRAGGSVTAGDLPGEGAGPGEYADACFDEEGILLEEWWVTGGEPIRQRVAVEVDTSVDVDEVLRLPRDPTIPVDQGGGGIQEIDPASAPKGMFWELGPGEVPAGFERRGRYSLVPTQTEAFQDVSSRGRIVATTVDVWVRGPDLLVVEQGATLEGESAFEPDPAAPTADLGRLGTGEIRLRLDRVEVRVKRPAGGFVRVYGTLPAADIVNVARALRETQGTGIDVLD